MSEFKLRGFDMEKFAETDHSNKVQFIKRLREEKLWHFFETFVAFYDDLMNMQGKEQFNSHSEVARFYCLVGNKINLVKGVANVLAGHFSESNLFLRRTVEGVRHAGFIRENQNVAKYWTEKAVMRNLAKHSELGEAKLEKD